MSSDKISGKLVIVAGPSGTGKTTIVRHLLSVFPRLAFSISATSRPKRANERDTEDYYFLSVEQFKEKIKHGEFIEWEEVYPGSYYGTLKSEVERLWRAGRHVIFDIDVKGALNLKKHFPEQSITVFIQPPSVDALMQRLRDRNTESPEILAQRISKAHFELTFAPQFDEMVYNRELDKAFKEAEGIVGKFLGDE
jgi:guanylate kinase